MKHPHYFFTTLCLSVSLLATFSCTSKESTADKEETSHSPSVSSTDILPQPKAPQQVVLAYTSHSEDHTGFLVGYEQINGTWQITYDSLKVNFGKAGFAPPGEKREGDKKSPTGVFKLGPAFGYQKDIDCAIDFVTLTENHYWISDSNSDDYNKLVTYTPESKAVEKMRRKDHLYRYGLVIQYNTEPAVGNKGSAIFIHNWRDLGKPTLGCISMPEEQTIKLIQWLRPEKDPLIFMGELDWVSSQIPFSVN